MNIEFEAASGYWHDVACEAQDGTVWPLPPDDDTYRTPDQPDAQGFE
jgi:hypothetical protein